MTSKQWMLMLNCIIILVGMILIGASPKTSAQEKNVLALPEVGAYDLRILSPTLVELSLVNTKEPSPATIEGWDFVNKSYQFEKPDIAKLRFEVDGKAASAEVLGFKRRPAYAPLKSRDLRIRNFLYLKLKTPLSAGQVLTIRDASGKLMPRTALTRTMDPLRWSPFLHVNQEGYLANWWKHAFVGFYLGSVGEFDTSNLTNFTVIEVGSNKEVFHGKLTLRKDSGYSYTPAPYQNVMEADFTELKQPGEYRLKIDGLGTSFPFHITDDTAALLTRTFALGMYHQRCGGANELPFTRFTHGTCHTALAEVPTDKFETVNAVLADVSQNYKLNSRHTAPQLKTVSASLYPFVTTNKIDVSGGHHDAGDYSKYTINCAQLIHALVFAADVFPGAGALDNLGLPESGDGKSDLLQEAKWEADFLAKLQDADGGFYFLVYPRDRQYEYDVLPDHSDPQVVFPKTTAATAAAVAALAQTASSPLFKQQFPEAAAKYLAKANKGWMFLEKAFKKYGRDGSYQKITHYGDEFMHDDEIAWAATELYLATGEEKYHKELLDHFNPSSPDAKRWTWWRMFESYGCAIRSYAFAARTKRLRRNQLDDQLFSQCENEIIANADDLVRYSDQNAYGTSFPLESKRFRNAGWYFSSDAAFDLAAACALDYPELNDPRPKYREALIDNFDYELGCNPVNVSFVAGLGWKRPREMVSQYAQNDRRALPPSGLIWGNIQEGFAYLDPYKKELGELTFPPDWDEKNPYPFYDRWGDSFNTTTECVTVNIAHALAAASYLMAQTPTQKQPWRATTGYIEFSKATNQLISATLKAPGLDTTKARCVWEAKNHEPDEFSNAAQPFTFAAKTGDWVEVEATWPDGRRVFAVTNFSNEPKLIGAK